MGIRVNVIAGRTVKDITAQVEGLSYSNVNPGGDEQATFQIRRQWLSGAPELAQGNILRITDGLDVLWQGRIDENDRAVESTEMVGIVAYGLGILLRESLLAEIYVDIDLSHWGEMSVARRLSLSGSYTLMSAGAPQPDPKSGSPSLRQTLTGATAGSGIICENFYDAQGISIGSVYYAWKKGTLVDNANALYHWYVYLFNDGDGGGSVAATTDLRAAGPGSGTLQASSADEYFAMLDYYYLGSLDDREFDLFWTSLAVYGNHGLTKQGTADYTNAQGFLASDIVSNMVGRISGLTARRIDPTTYVVRQLEFRDPVEYEEAITQASRFDLVDWGVWGPDSIFDISTKGYFDWKQRDSATSHWMLSRADCDDLSLTSELSPLYNAVEVKWTDVAGASHLTTRTATVPVLDEASPPITRTKTIDAGTTTLVEAQQLGDTFLALSGQQAPARGSISLTKKIRHYRRGKLSPHYMRADGSNVRLLDVLAARDLFSLTSQPDRRTTFPIKRVSVDVAGAIPRVSIEVDQTNDLISTLQARLDAARFTALQQ